MGVHSGSGKVFNWFANMTAVAGLLTWFGISVTYIRFYAGMKVQGIDRTTLPFSSRLQPYAAWYATISCAIICLVGVSDTFHFQLDIDPKLSYTVQRLVGFPPWELGHSRLYHELPAPCDFPHIIRWREVLEEVPTCPCVRDGFLHRNRRDRGRYLRRAPAQKQGGSLLAVVGE
jgi:Amino acid permease